MAVSLGKRKRRQAREVPVTLDSHVSDDEEDRQALQDIFRKHFEAKYKPLPLIEKKAAIELLNDLSVSEEDDEDEWSGFSGDEQTTVQIVQHVDITETQEETNKRELREFLSSKVPMKKALDRPKRPLVLNTKADEDEDSAINLKNDLALQRLLSESHILSKDQPGGLKPTGKLRHKALDLRFQALGSKDSIFAQKGTPMKIKTGINRKRAEREMKRRSDAKEGNIILEKQVKEKKAVRKRERGVGGPAVGNFKRGLLKLSREDVRDIQGSKGKGLRRR